ncbi:Crp/Fnr family transcriptional regulator [Paraflavitalea pollutisoli]|uniref:Crp/Fnr family transcriptional regulator n=1 Tax=Paraflavitalea pollutisoli TaxID=3034143 RepID=UPI0023ECB2A5|nr:Crp/Fnr family transcriptional regulator [Paraflavitalea sp. H1-2-19X]
MNTGFETYLRNNSHLTDDEIAQIAGASTTRSLSRNESLLQEGQVCRHKTYVISGLLRIYGLVADGSEHILQFAPEAHWTLDAESYDQQTPSRFNIAAIERSEVIVWSKPVFDRLLADIPALRALSQQLIARSNHGSRQRLFTALSATPEEKYEEFVRTHADLQNRLPLHMIAAYLGISLKTLTRIRHAQIRR